MIIPLKQWCAEESTRLGIKPHSVWVRISRGHYPWLAIRRTNQRIVHVDVEASYDWLGLGAITEGTNLRA